MSWEKVASVAEEYGSPLHIAGEYWRDLCGGHPLLSLEKTRAPVTFLVFGNDRQVPRLWLERYGALVSGVTSYFLSDDGHLELLAPLVDPARST
jgi:hypothetical protein